MWMPILAGASALILVAQFAPVQSPVSPSLASRVLSVFQGSSTALAPKHLSEIKGLLERNPEANQVVCTGFSLKGASASAKSANRKRALSACNYATRIDSDLEKLLVMRDTTSRAMAGRVSVSLALVDRFEPDAVMPQPPTPSVTQVGNILAVLTPGWETGVTFSFQWLRNMANIPGATGREYVFDASDTGRQISVVVTGTKEGFLPRVRISNPIVPTSPTGVSTAPTPTVTPVPTPTVTPVPTPTVTPIPTPAVTPAPTPTVTPAPTPTVTPAPTPTVTPAPTPTVTPVPTPTVTPSPTPTVTPQVTGNLTLTPVPTIVGSAFVGETLTANPGTWDSGVSLTYQWLRSDVAISGATSATYVLKSEDRSHAIAVRVTGSKPGFTPVTRTSAARQLAPACTSTQAVLLGDAVVGNTLQVEVRHLPEGCSAPTLRLIYRWMRNGVEMSGVTGSTYTLTPNSVFGPSQDAGKRISAKAIMFGCSVCYEYSTEERLVSNPLSLTPVPTISSNGQQVGATLTLNPGTWDPGVSLSYQWLRNGSPISGATGLSYTLGVSDGAQNVSVQVTGSRPGFDSAVRTSDAISVPGAALAQTPTPSLGGVGRAGASLIAYPNDWDAGVTLSYQWLRNGSAIAGATGTTYRCVTEDVGQTISIQVTGTKPGFLPVTRTSAGRVIAPAN